MAAERSDRLGNPREESPREQGLAGLGPEGAAQGAGAGEQMPWSTEQTVGAGPVMGTSQSSLHRPPPLYLLL